ncbi:TPA: cobaltochelatase subunit CobN, partial [Candidatus Poribacteria bacterium]|nr:cobaltochelatase subunit CobN [Candidatus Poribacteria bacterium]
MKRFGFRHISFALIGAALIGGAALLYYLMKASKDEPIAFVGAWDRAVPLLLKASQETGIPIEIIRPSDVSESPEKFDFTRYPLVFVLNLGGNSPFILRDLFVKSREKTGRPKVVSLDYRDTQKTLEKAGVLIYDEEVRKYWRYNGLVNMKRLLRYARAKLLGRGGKVEPPVVIPDYGFYHPESEKIFQSYSEYIKWLKEKGHLFEGRPTIAFMMQQSFWVTGQTDVIDAVIREFERRRINVATLFVDTAERLRRMLFEVKPRLILTQTHGTIVTGPGMKGVNALQELGAPYLNPIAMLGTTLDEWREGPMGLSYHDISLHIILQEVTGAIEPIVTGGLVAKTSSYRVQKPIDERVRRFADRAVAWLKLQEKPNSQKRIAIIYYSKFEGGGGKSAIARGSPTGAYLNAPRSIPILLRRLKEEGYILNYIPTEEELLEMMMERGRNIGPWAKGELKDLVEKGDPILIPVERYMKWFEKLPPENRKAVIDRFGEPPGRIMVYEKDGKRYIVIPRIDLGNVILAPQPERGESFSVELLHARDVPPPHQYIAFYFWLQKEFKADVVIHFGTHGSLELMPLKEAGLSSYDWGDILIGNIPHLYIWIIDNLGEATIAKRRSYAALVDHLVPPIVNAGLSGELKELNSDIEKFNMLEPGLLKEQYRKTIAEKAQKLRIVEDLHLTPKEGRLSDKEIKRISEYLEEIYHEKTPVRLHVLGRLPEKELLVSYIVSILGNRFLDHLSKVIPPPKRGDRRAFLRAKGEEIVRKLLLEKLPPGRIFPEEIPKELRADLDFAKNLWERFLKVGSEIDNLIIGLKGRYIPPGPGGDPIRNPSAVPTGRNMFAVNPEEIPTKQAWEIGKMLVDQMLKRKLKEGGRYPRKVGFDLNGMETMRHLGVTEAQILYLLGVQPVWDENGLVLDVRLIPREKLGRPRIDVFIAAGGIYRNNFPSRMELLDKAVRLAAEAKEEEENYVREGTAEIKRKLAEKG